MTALSRLRLRPWQDFDKTEMSLGPRPGLSIRFGARRLAVARRGMPNFLSSDARLPWFLMERETN